MKTSFKAIAQVSISILILSACAPTEGYTDQFPQHVSDVVEQLEQGGYTCENPTVFLNSGNAFVESDYDPDGLTCNESESNYWGDEFSVFASEEEAASYYQHSCNNRPNGWFVFEFMISPTVALSNMKGEKTIEQANELANVLGYSNAQEIASSCDYSDLSW